MQQSCIKATGPKPDKVRFRLVSKMELLDFNEYFQILKTSYPRQAEGRLLQRESRTIY